MRVRIRRAKADDLESDLESPSWSRELNFVRVSFRRVVNITAGLLHTATDPGASRLLERVLTNPRTQVLMAVKADDDDEIVGYAVATGDVLSMVLVKREHRRVGACRALLEGLPAPLRCWWPHRNLEHLAKCTGILVDPLAILEL